MRKTLGAMFVGTCVLACTAPAQPGEDGDARAIITKAIDAMGGAGALDKHKASTWKETGTYYGMGDGVPFIGVYAAQPPDKFKMEISGFFTIVFTGDKGWVKMGGETRDMDKDELATHRNDHRAGSIASIAPLTSKDFTLKAIGEVKVEDRPAVGVKVTRKDYPEVKLYFDKKTNLLVKSEWPTKAAEQKYKDVTVATYYSDYKKIDGVQVPTHLVMKRDGKPYVEAEVNEYKAAGKLDDATFAKP
jgi:hypothetical protein